MLQEPSLESGLGSTDQATPNGISSGGWMPRPGHVDEARGSRRRSGSRSTRRSLRMRSAKSGQADASVVAGRASASMGGRRYTPAMGAVETMEDFFEKLNGGDREGAVALMDEKTEMRVHVGDSVQTLRGVERVGGWFLRGDAGLRMIPGDIRDTGNTYEADLLVVRPGAPSQHIDATFRVEAGQDHRHQHRAQIAADGRPAARRSRRVRGQASGDSGDGARRRPRPDGRTGMIDLSTRRRSGPGSSMVVRCSRPAAPRASAVEVARGDLRERVALLDRRRPGASARGPASVRAWRSRRPRSGWASASRVAAIAARRRTAPAGRTARARRWPARRRARPRAGSRACPAAIDRRGSAGRPRSGAGRSHDGAVACPARARVPRCAFALASDRGWS